MTWAETIQYIRTQPDYQYLVEKAYFEENLTLNIDRFRAGDEWNETVKLVRKYQPTGKKVLDVGSGNGISAVSFALEGYSVVALEPDSSDTIGAGAIRWLKEHYQLDNLEIIEDFSENLNFPTGTFDIVYARQAMHHAYDLKQFVQAAAQGLATGGLFLTVRDHVILDERDKKWFLESHPLQKFYGGENAFRADEYRRSFEQAGLRLAEEIHHYDSVINYYPLTQQQLADYKLQLESYAPLEKKIGKLAHIHLIQKLYDSYRKRRVVNILDEKNIPGRLYSYVAIKA